MSGTRHEANDPDQNPELPGDGKAGSPELTGDVAAAASATAGKAISGTGAAAAAVSTEDVVTLEGTVAAEEMDKLDRGALER